MERFRSPAYDNGAGACGALTAFGCLGFLRVNPARRAIRQMGQLEGNSDRMNTRATRCRGADMGAGIASWPEHRRRPR
ncbi:hypothetical protein CHELA40_10949 [Chelatococcus asaccharovorans]|nr:hypothetical protein CHELA40_10949 [Chelatococcus asaccharovorans]CAH1685723.1 hypothetical protein CHELA17_64649 [Chelatococcus asaccharovorans]